MKYLYVLILPLLIFSCTRPHPISNVYPWPSSGVVEADSLMLLYEHSMATLESDRKPGRMIISEFCSIASLHPDNRILQMRKRYLVACTIPPNQKEKFTLYLEESFREFDSVVSPYDWHRMKTLSDALDIDPYRLYQITLDNISYFSSMESEVDVARNLLILGNVMYYLHDYEKALESYKEAEKIFLKYERIPSYLIAKNNEALASDIPTADSLYNTMLNDSLFRIYPKALALLYQNSYLAFDSLPLIENAIEVIQNNNIDKKNLYMCQALLGQHLVKTGHPQEGLNILEEVRKNMETDGYETRYIWVIYRILGDAYLANDMKDSCAEALSRSLLWRDSLDIELNRPRIYALDAKERIAAANKTARLERDRLIMWWVVSFLAISLVAVVIVFRLRHKKERETYERRLLEEKMENDRKSLQAQAKVMEESDKMITNINTTIATLAEKKLITEEGVANISRLMKLYHSNEESRQGFLKASREYDTYFLTRLKDDFPDLTETQLRLATIIVSGIENRQISNIMNIEMASLRKSRYRLRSRLGLSKDQSLEDFLRRYNQQPPSNK